MSGRFGLLGEKLGHSFSPMLHGMLGDYGYTLIERAPDELEELFASGEYDGFNVTIPYKKAVIPFMSELTDTARRCGSVNTVVRRADGTYLGDNTDFYGFSVLLSESGLSVEGKKVLVLGDGGVAPTVREVLKDARVGETVTISRRGENNYENLSRHADCSIIVNTTPVGMYPSVGASPLDISVFPRLEGVIDLIFNPLRTELMLRAEEAGLTAAGGLLMLAAQAVRASERFTGATFDEPSVSRRLCDAVLRAQTSVFIIGMPGCGKTTVGRELAKHLGRELADADALLTARIGDIPAFFRDHGEEAFRREEAKLLAELGARSGLVLATGGGCVTREENYRALHQNGTIVWLRRDLAQLPTEGRPVSQRDGVQAIYERRKPLYESFADLTIENTTPEETVTQLLRLLEQ